MHQCIRFIIYAKTPEQACIKAQDLLDERLTGDGRPFDYGNVLDLKANNNWGVANVTLADSKDGKKLIKDGIDYTKKHFMESIKEVRLILDKYSDDEIFEEREDPKKDLKKAIINKLEGKSDRGMWKHSFYQVGKYDGSDIFLYDNDGESIRDSHHLKNTLDKWKCLGENRPKLDPDDKVWVVCADVHF